MGVETSRWKCGDCGNASVGFCCLPVLVKLGLSLFKIAIIGCHVAVV